MSLVKLLTVAFKNVNLAAPTHITKAIIPTQLHQNRHRWSGRFSRGPSEPPKDLQPLDGRKPIADGLRRHNREFVAQSAYQPEQSQHRYGYEAKYYFDGLLPRSKKLKDMPLQGKPFNARQQDRFTPKRALKGQNDYIDILGDGNIQPSDLMQGPEWLRRFRGNELQRIVRQLEFAGTYMHEMRPMELHMLNKRLFYLYRRYNKRRPEPYSWKKPEKFTENLPAGWTSRFERYNKNRE